MKAYSAGGGGGTSYSAGDGIDITGDTISVKVDHGTIDYNESGQLEYVGPGPGPSGGYTMIEYKPGFTDNREFLSSISGALNSNLIPVVQLTYPTDDGNKYVKLVLSNSILTTHEGPSDAEYWFVGSTFEATSGGHGTLRHTILTASYSGESDRYEVHTYYPVQDNVTYS